MQQIYDAFNNLIFNEDTKILGKFVAKVNLLNLVSDIPGDIVECGVFKGSGIVSWLKLKKILYPNSQKKVIGFDFFDSDSLLSSLQGKDLEEMEELFVSRAFRHERDFSLQLSKKIQSFGFSESEFELVVGDISGTAFDFVSRRPGFKISLLYLDLDLNTPTFSALSAFWDRVSRGGAVVFDEYAYHQWSESVGVDKFFEDKNVTVRSLNYNAPTAYVVKV